MTSNFGSENLKIGWVAGMPRSGTTWLSQIFASSPDVRLKFCPLFSYEFKNALDETSTADDWAKLFRDVYDTKSEYLDQEYLRRQGLVPEFTIKEEHPKHLFIKSTRFHHLVPGILRLNTRIRFVHIVRHPCATIYSWLTNPYEFPPDADPMTEWRTGNCRKTGPGEFWGFDDWKAVTSQALRLEETFPHRFRIIRYEDLVRETETCTENLFEFFGLPYEQQTRDFIEHAHARHDESNRSVFKNPELRKPWPNLLDPSIVTKCLAELKDTELERFLH